MSASSRHRVAGPAPATARPGATRSRGQALSSNAGTTPNRALTQTLTGGVPLEPLLRAEMEARFGEDFGQVRIHDDAGAHRAADSQLAHAFTAGRRIVFGRGRFQPGSEPGKRLLAHELAHVVQQSRPSSAPATASHEAEADATAGAAVHGQPARVTGSAGVAVQREPMTDSEIASLPLDAVVARLDANQAEASRMVLSLEAVDALDQEHRLLEARRAQLEGHQAPGLDAPVPPPAGAQGVPVIKLEPARAETEAEKEAHDQQLLNHPADAQQAAALAARGIEHYGMSPVPYTDGTGPHKAIRVGNYILGPNAIECQDRSYAVQYYIAYHVPSKQNQWVVGPESVDAFRARHAKDEELLEYMGALHPYEVNSVRWVEKAMGGDFSGAFSHLGTAWSEAVRDPKWQLQALAAHIPVERLVAPLLKRAAPMVLAGSMRGASEVLPLTAAREIPALVQPATRAVAAEVRPAIAAAAPAPLKAVATPAANVVAAPIAKQAGKTLPVAPMIGRAATVTAAKTLMPAKTPKTLTPPKTPKTPKTAKTPTTSKPAANPKPPKVIKPAQTTTPAKTVKPPKPPKPAKSLKPVTPVKPPKQVKKPTQAAQQTKSIDEQIADAERDLQASRTKTSSYFDARAAADQSRKGGPKKGIDNAKERVWLLKRQKAYPDRQVLKNGKVKGVQGPDGKFRSTKSIAGKGREPDFVELDPRTGKATLGELKSEWELNRSLVGGPGTTRGGTTSVAPGSKMGRQFSAEDKVLAEARKTNSKVVVTGYDVQTGMEVKKLLDPDQISRNVFSSTGGWGPGNVWTQ